MTTLIKFENRNSSDLMNQKLMEIARNGPKFDVDLIGQHGKTVPAHRLVLAMYSMYLRRILKNASPENKYLVPLADFPQSVLEKVVELFYYGEVRVLTAFKGKVYKALAFLEVVDIKLPDPPKPRTKKTPESELLEILAIDGLSTSGTSGPQIVNNNGANEKSVQPKQNPNVNGQQPKQQQQQQQQQNQQKQKQQPRAKQTPNTVSTEAIIHGNDEINKKGGNSGVNSGDFTAQSVTDAMVGSNGIVSDEMEEADLTVNGANGGTSLNVDLSTSEISPSLLYDDDIDGEMDELGKAAEDLFLDIGATGSNAKNPYRGEAEPTQ